MGKSNIRVSKKHATVMTSFSSEDGDQTFVDEKSRLKYEKEVVKRRFHLEKKVSFSLTLIITALLKRWPL